MGRNLLNHSLELQSERLAKIAVLAHFCRKSRCWTTIGAIVFMLLTEILAYIFCQALLCSRILTQLLDAAPHLLRQGFSHQCLFRGKVVIKRAVGEPGRLHDLPDTHRAEAALPEQPAGLIQDLLMLARGFVR